MPADPKAIAERVIVSRDNAASCPTADVDTLARAYLALLPPAGAWSHDEGDVVLTHPDGSTERFYAGERAPYVAAACSRYEALVSDLPVVIEAAKRVIDLYDEDQMDSLGFAARRMTAMTALRAALAEVDRG